MRIKFLDYHNPKVWAAYENDLAPFSCICHGSSLEAVLWHLSEWFGSERPVMIEKRMAEIDERMSR